MKEIHDLKALSMDPNSLRRKYELQDLKVQKDYGDDYFEELITQLNWGKETLPILELWMYSSYFDEYIENLINQIKDRIDNAMNFPSAPSYKTEYLTSTVKEIIQLNIDFYSLGTQFGRASQTQRIAIQYSSLKQFPIFDSTNKFSGKAMVKDAYNFTLNFLRSDGKEFFDQFKNFSVNNLLALLCDGIGDKMLCLIDFVAKTYPKHYDEKDLMRFLKKMPNAQTKEVEISKRGRPQKKESKETLSDIWDNKKRSFDSVVSMLIEPRPIFDNERGFIIKENDRLIWLKEPASCHVKYIQGFLLFCHKEKNIDLEKYSSRALQSIFQRTFSLSVNNKSMISKNILQVKEMYYRQFW